jgi:hypothetical protein
VGEWLEYTVDVAKTGTYSVTAYLASTSGGGKMQLKIGSVSSPLITAPKTTSSTAMQPVTVTINMTQGQQIIRLNIKAIPTFSIDRLEFSEYISVGDSKKVNFSIYPNPASNQLEVELTGEIIQTAHIYNSMGQLVLSKNIDNEKASIDVTDLEAGMYLISIETNSGISKATFVKQ